MAKVRTKREMRTRRKRFMAMAGTMDFLGVVGSCAVIIICVMLLMSLTSWVRSDIPETLQKVEYAISTAIVTPE